MRRVAGYGPCLAATNHLHAAKVTTIMMLFGLLAGGQASRLCCRATVHSGVLHYRLMSGIQDLAAA